MFGAAGDGPEVNYDADGPGSAACVKCVACEHVQHTVSSLCSVSLSLFACPALPHTWVLFFLQAMNEMADSLQELRVQRPRSDRFYIPFYPGRMPHSYNHGIDACSHLTKSHDADNPIHQHTAYYQQTWLFHRNPETRRGSWRTIFENPLSKMATERMDDFPQFALVGFFPHELHGPHGPLGPSALVDARWRLRPIQAIIIVGDRSKNGLDGPPRASKIYWIWLMMAFIIFIFSCLWSGCRVDSQPFGV